MPQAALGVEAGPAELDFITRDVLRNGGGSDSVAHRLLASGNNINSLRTLGVLRENEWREYDQSVTEIARDQYTIVADLLGAGLRKPLKNAMGTTALVWDRIGDMDDAQVDMTAEAVDIRDRLEYGQDGMPLPLIHKGFRLDIRTLAASRKSGEGLDVTHVEAATRKVIQTIEKLFLTGNFSAGMGAGRVYGVTAFPYRITGSLSVTWVTATAAQIWTDMNAMIGALEAKGQFGPYGMYIPRAFAPRLRDDYDRTTATGTSIRSRLMEIADLKWIKVHSFLTGTNVIVIQLRKGTIEVIEGIQPRVVEWSAEGGMIFLFKVIAMILPRIRRDALDQVGIAHYS